MQLVGAMVELFETIVELSRKRAEFFLTEILLEQCLA
jgi:hypothetical protein